MIVPDPNPWRCGQCGATSATLPDTWTVSTWLILVCETCLAADDEPEETERKIYVEVDECDLESDDRFIRSVAARCSRCGHENESYGTSQRSVNRCMVLMRDECPLEEDNYYTDDRDAADPIERVVPEAEDEGDEGEELVNKAHVREGCSVCDFLDETNGLTGKERPRG